MKNQYFIEVSFNVWNCNAKLHVEIWQGNEHTKNLIESILIPCTQTEIKKNIERINISGVYPAGKLNKKTDGLVKIAIMKLMEKYLNS
jgi:hypothetical protein